MGHRIELGEIEAAASAIDDIGQCCAMYNRTTQEIILVYDGKADRETVIMNLRGSVPRYMIPQVLHQLDAMPHNLNGKIDRALLSKQFIQ